MKAILVKDGKGPIENLYIGETATPAVKSREVLVKVRTTNELRTAYAPLTSYCAIPRQISAFSLNRMDVLQRQGLYPVPQDASEILGVEFSGHVTALGPDTSATWAIGDQVLGLASGVSQHRGRYVPVGRTVPFLGLGRLCRIYCCTGNADPPQATPAVLGGGREHPRGFHHR